MSPVKSLTWQLAALLVLCACATMASADVLDEIDRNDTNGDEKISADEMAQIRTKVDSMSDEELSVVLAAAMPHQRNKRTLGTVRRCLEKVRCLFGNLKRHKRETSPAAVLRAISKLLGVANNAAKELLGKRLGGSNGGGLDTALLNLFRGPKASSSASDTASDSLASSSSADAVSQAIDEDNSTGAASQLAEEKVCDQRCNLSVLVYRRLRRLLRRL